MYAWAECNIDHRLLRMQRIIGQKIVQQQWSLCKCFHVSLLGLCDGDDDEQATIKEHFVMGVCEQMKKMWGIQLKVECVGADALLGEAC